MNCNNTSPDQYNDDDEVTIAETLARLGIEYTGANRVAFNNAINQKLLKKVANRQGRTIYLRWGDVKVYMAKGTHHLRRRKGGPRTKRQNDPVIQQGEPIPIAEPVEAADHPDEEPAGIGLVNGDLDDDIANAKIMLKDADSLPDDELVDRIKTLAAGAEWLDTAAANLGRRALVSAWTCGRLLNTIKQKLGHGSFGKWRCKHLVPAVMSERTSRRYMELPKKCDTLERLVAEYVNLDGAYRGLGINGQSHETPSDQQDDSTKPAAKTKADNVKSKFLSSTSNLKKSIRQFNQAGVRLAPDEINQLKLVSGAIQELIARQEELLNSDHAA